MLFNGAPLPFRIVFGTVLDVLPADLGLEAASEIVSVDVLNKVASKSVAITSINFRLRFMEPPGPLATGD